MRLPNRLYLLLGISILLTSCSATNRLTMNAVEPARIHIPKEVLKIGLINRSIPSEDHQVIDKLDKILSLEGLNLDKEGAESALNGLRDELSLNDRFKSVEIIDSIALQQKGLGVFPAALAWRDVQKICDDFDVDILFSLEFFDTDTKVDYEVGMVDIPNPLGIDVSMPGHKVTLNTLIKNGWRVYDPVDKILLDEIVLNERIISTGQGINPVKAIEAVIGRKEIVLQRSADIGYAYGLDVRPLQRRIARDYFVRGTDNFKIARRRAQTGNWNGAAELWEKELDHSKGKVAGRAHYNMAIINEINGDLDAAVDWASKSYSDYGNRDALRYVNILRNRMAKERLLDRQLSR